MNVVIDTNVVFSGIFFGGVPGRILELSSYSTFKIVLTEPIIAEYLELIYRYKTTKKLNDISSQLAVIDNIISHSLIVDTNTYWLLHVQIQMI